MVYLIALHEIMEFFGDGSRMYKEGDAVYTANHLMYKAITKETNSSVDLLFLCLRSSNLFGAPHEINVKLFMENGEKKTKVSCSCAAGTAGKCKHGVAALIYLLRFVKFLKHEG